MWILGLKGLILQVIKEVFLVTKFITLIQLTVFLVCD